MDNYLYVYEHYIKVYTKQSEVEDLIISDNIKKGYYSDSKYYVSCALDSLLNDLNNNTNYFDGFIKDVDSDYFIKMDSVIKVSRIRKYLVAKYRLKKRRKFKRVKRFFGLIDRLEFDYYYYTYHRVERRDHD